MSGASGRAFALDEGPPVYYPSLPAAEVLRRVSGSFAAVLAEAVRTSSRAGTSEKVGFRRQAFAAHRLAGRLAELNGLRLSVAGVPPRCPSVLVSNHLGYWDPLLLASLLPLVAIAKAELASWPLLGFCGRALGTLYVRRGDTQDGARVLRQALRRLLAGVHVLNFPEGTTTSGDEVLPFRRGLFGIAAKARVAVVPVAMRLWPADAAWLGGEAFLPHYRRHWQRGARLEASIRFGRPLQPSDFSTAQACAYQARLEVQGLLGRSGA